MLHRNLMLLILLVNLFSWSGMVSAESPKQILVYNIWATPSVDTKGEADNTSLDVNLQIENNTENTVTFVGVFTEVGEEVEVDPVEIPAGERLNFMPEGDHISLMNVAEPLEPGHAFPITFTFDTGEDESIEIPAAALVLEAPPESHPFVIYDTWARFAFSGEGSVSAVYLELENRGDESDRLVEIVTEAAESVEIHESTITNDVMSMSHLESLELPADGEPVAIDGKPYHIMLINLTEDLMIGSAITIVLRFESGREIEVAIPVLAEAVQQQEEPGH